MFHPPGPIDFLVTASAPFHRFMVALPFYKVFCFLQTLCGDATIL